MRTLPLAARLYLFILWSVATTLTVVALLFIQLSLDLLPLLLIWLLLYVLADYFEVEFEIRDGNRVMMTVYEAPTVFLVAVGGPIGVLIILAGTLIVDTLHRRPWYRISFNAAERIITYLAMWTVYMALRSPSTLPFGDPRGLA